MSSSDYIDLEEKLYNLGYYDNLINVKPFYGAISPAMEVFLSRKEGEISASDSASQINALKKSIRANNTKNMYIKKH